MVAGCRNHVSTSVDSKLVKTTAQQCSLQVLIVRIILNSKITNFEVVGGRLGALEHTFLHRSIKPQL